MVRVVVDTNVYISAISRGGRPRMVIDLARDNKIQIFTSIMSPGGKTKKEES